MRIRTRSRVVGSGWALVSCAWLAALAWTGAAWASQTGQAEWSAAELRLKSEVVARFHVLPARSGLILLPRGTREAIQSVEVGDGTVAVNGALVTGAELGDRLGPDADLIARLSFLEPDRRRRLMLEAPAATEAPPAEREPDRPGRSGRRGESADERLREYRREVETRIRIGGPVTVPADERVRGPVVVVGGRADVLGRVDDAVVVVGGTAHLGPEAVVAGDITVIGGTVERERGSDVGGQVNIIGIDLPRIDFRPWHRGGWLTGWRGGWGPGWPAAPWRLAGTLFRFALFGLILAVLVLLARRGTGRVARTVAAEPWKAGLVGLFAELLVVPIIVLTVLILTVSIVGIPLLLLVPFAVLALVFAFFLGFAGVASAIGSLGERRLGWAPQARVVSLIIGLSAIWVLTLVGRVVGMIGWPAVAVASALMGLGFLIEYVAWTVGFGAALLTRMGSRDRHPEPLPDYPPPVPDPGAPAVDPQL